MPAVAQGWPCASTAAACAISSELVAPTTIAAMYGAAIYVDRRAPVRLIQEVFAIAGGCFRILVDAHEDRLKQSPAERHDGMESAAQSDYSLCAGKTGAIGTTSPDQAGALTASPARGDDNSHWPRLRPSCGGHFSGSHFRFAFGRMSKSFAYPRRSQNAWPDTR